MTLHNHHCDLTRTLNESLHTLLTLSGSQELLYLLQKLIAAALIKGKHSANMQIELLPMLSLKKLSFLNSTI
jgi:hypothetical protein